MTSRRDLILASVAGSAMAKAKASQPATKLAFTVPKGACDCHTHIFNDPERFPWAKDRAYTPEAALPREMLRLHGALHVERVVIVNPSVYGTDNAATLHGIRVYGLVRARGIAVVAANETVNGLRGLDKHGCRGVRLNFATGTSKPDIPAMQARLQRALAQVRPVDWHVQIYTDLAGLTALESGILEAAPMPIVLDHVSGARPADGLQQAGFDVLMRLLQTGHVYVKVTHRFFSTGAAPDFADAAPLAKTLIAAKPDRILWGTDWPHPNSTSGRPPKEVSPLENIDDGAMFNRFAACVSDEATLRRILVENPAHLYKF